MPLTLHVHTVFSDGRGLPETYCRMALKEGLKVIGFSEHLVALPSGKFAPYSIKPDEVDKFLEVVDSLRTEFKGELKVLAGLEVDYIPGTVEAARRVVADHALDYTLVSVHRLGDWVIDRPASADRWRAMSVEEVYRAYRRYFELLLEAVEAGFSNIVAHMDLVKKFRKHSEILDAHCAKLLEAVAEHELLIEINTSGLRHPVSETYPSLEAVKLARELEVNVTIGTDAHAPNQVASGVGEAVRILREAGYPQVAYLEAGSPRFLTL